MKNKNYWGYHIYSPNEILYDVKLISLIKEVLIELLYSYGVDRARIEDFIADLFNYQYQENIINFEKKAQKLFNYLVDGEKKEHSYRKRAEIISSQIAKYVVGEKIADYGCGDGLVSYFLSRKWYPHFEFKLFDIKDYRNKESNFEFELIKANEPLNRENEFETILLLTVLHHSINPQLVLNNAISLCKKRIIVIESVFDVPNDDAYSPISNLDIETQIKYAIFWDWFYNRIIHEGIVVPYNFQTPLNWEKTFTDNELNIIYRSNLGVDQKIVPEHHYLFILEKK